jgi:hypothetical protein
MKTRSIISALSHLVPLCTLGVLLLAGCASPYSQPSKLMQPAGLASETPPPGKTLVCIHRPRAAQGYGLYTGVWDSKHLIADLGNGQSVAYVCDPGKHYFIDRSVELISVVEADLLPESTYDLWVDTAGTWIASFKLKPVTHGSKEQSRVAGWLKENHWVTRGPAAIEHERERTPEIELILHDFVGGEKASRVQHLSTDDHR